MGKLSASLATLDTDDTFGFNIATFLTLRPEFGYMLGFTQQKVEGLLDEIYHDFQFDPETRPGVDAAIKNHYNGYHFINTEGEALYNSTILMYFLHYQVFMEYFY